MPAQRPPTIDETAALRWAQRCDRNLSMAAPWLHEEVGRRMQERLQWIKKEPTVWAHWAPVRGGLQAHRQIALRYPKSTCFMVEAQQNRAQAAIKLIAKPWWIPAHWSAAPHLAQTPDGAAVQMLWANMLLHTQADPMALIAQWQKALAVDGFLMFSCLGPDTVRELRELYAKQGWPSCSHEFTDMHDWGDMLVQAGFAEPVMDMERMVLSFATPERALQELRGLGRNLHPQRFAGLRGRAWKEQLHATIAQNLSNSGQDGAITLTFEIIYGHAFKPAPKIKMSAQSSVSMQDMRAMLARR